MRCPWKVGPSGASEGFKLALEGMFCDDFVSIRQYYYGCCYNLLNALIYVSQTSFITCFAIIVPKTNTGATHNANAKSASIIILQIKIFKLIQFLSCVYFFPISLFTEDKWTINRYWHSHPGKCAPILPCTSVSVSEVSHGLNNESESVKSHPLTLYPHQVWKCALLQAANARVTLQNLRSRCRKLACQSYCTVEWSKWISALCTLSGLSWIVALKISYLLNNAGREKMNGGENCTLGMQSVVIMVAKCHCWLWSHSPIHKGESIKYSYVL